MFNTHLVKLAHLHIAAHLSAVMPVTCMCFLDFLDCSVAKEWPPAEGLPEHKD